MVDPKRELLRDALYHRVGELLAQLGRYDMYALSLAQQIGAHVRRPSFAGVGLFIVNRGIAIRRRMMEICIDSSIQMEFASIDASMRAIVDRLAIAAHRGAPMAFQMDAVFGASDQQPNRDWFDHHGLSNAEMSQHIDSFEREGLKVVALYLRIAACAAAIGESTKCGDPQ